MMYFRMVIVAIAACFGGEAASANDVIGELKQGGYVLVIRHTATDESQKDVFPFRYDDMKLQRQLSENGRAAAGAIGADIKKAGIPLDKVYTSKLNRAVETGKLLTGKEVETRDELTDSGAGSASSMANPTGANTKVGAAIRTLANAAPASGSNNVLVTHKTNIADAFGKEYADVSEGESIILKPESGSQAKIIGRIKPSDWRQ